MWSVGLGRLHTEVNILLFHDYCDQLHRAKGNSLQNSQLVLQHRFLKYKRWYKIVKLFKHVPWKFRYMLYQDRGSVSTCSMYSFQLYTCRSSYTTFHTSHHGQSQGFSIGLTDLFTQMVKDKSFGSVVPLVFHVSVLIISKQTCNCPSLTYCVIMVIWWVLVTRKF